MRRMIASEPEDVLNELRIICIVELQYLFGEKYSGN